MKINYTEDGLEDLEGYTYLYRRNVFRRKGLYYKFISKCVECGGSFLMRLSYPTKFCGSSCANGSKITRAKISKSLTGHKKSEQECAAISNRMSKGGVTLSNTPLFNTYAHQISPIEETKNNNGVLEVKCALCHNWFTPKMTHVIQRVQYIKGNINRENRFYCSDNCKHACPIFNKHTHPTGYNPRAYRNRQQFTEGELRVWSQEVFKRHDFLCEYCGRKATQAHHIQPKKLQPFFALDPDNGVACCETCHYKYGHIDECSSVNISKVLC